MGKIDTRNVINMLTALLLSGFYILDMSSLCSVVLLGGTFLIFTIYAWQNNFKIHFTLEKFHINILVMVLYCVCSTIWTLSPSLSIENAITLFELLICMSVLYMNYSTYDSIQDLYYVLMLAGALVAFYTLATYGIGTIISTIAIGGRLPKLFANINAIAMISTMCIDIYIYRILYRKNSFWQMCFFGIASVCSLIVIVATGSRKALVTVVFCVMSIFFIRFKSRRFLNTLLKWITLLVVGIIILKVLSNFSFFDGINERMEGLFALITGKGIVDASARVRQEYVDIGLAVFRQHPILGIGMGASGTYLSSITGANEYFHNNYIELLACGGIIGSIFYYKMWLYPFCRLIKMRKKAISSSSFSIILIIVLLIMDYGMVTYLSKNTYLYLMIFYVQVKYLQVNQNYNEENSVN